MERHDSAPRPVRGAGMPLLSITVDGGIHTGAASVMQADGITVLGSAGDSDLRLFDKGIAPHHAAIGVNGNNHVLRAMEGECRVNTRTLQAGDSAPIVAGDRIVLADTGVSLGVVDRETEVGEVVEPASKRRPFGFNTLVLSMLAFTLVAAAGARLSSIDMSPVEASIGVNNAIEALGLKGLAVSTEGAVVRVRGVLSNEEHATLDTALLGLPGEVVNLTQPEGLLLEQVSSVFRTNGYHAELEHSGGGVVTVSNLDATNPLIQQVVARVKSDVPMLSSLVLLPVKGTDRPSNALAAYPSDPAKRLTTIIDGDTAYVATTDGGRYFVGSVLPGGLVLRQITADGIQVDNKGEIHWLSL